MEVPGRLGRWGRAALVALGTGVAVSLAGCGTLGTGGFTPKPVETIPAPTPSRTPSVRPTSASPSSTPSQEPPATAKATGSLSLFAPATKKLVGVCVPAGAPDTLKLSDRKNDFFGTIGVALMLDEERDGVASLTIQLGEDSELIKRELTYSAAKPAKGTSAKLVVNGRTYKVTGKAQNFEDGEDAGTMPYSLTITCAKS